jgi:hypothetical protein
MTNFLYFALLFMVTAWVVLLLFEYSGAYSQFLVYSSTSHRNVGHISHPTNVSHDFDTKTDNSAPALLLADNTTARSAPLKPKPELSMHVSGIRFHMLLFRFGKWDHEVRYWLHFVKFHPEVIYTVLSDIPDFGPFAALVPKNVRLFTISLSEISKRANRIVGIPGDAPASLQPQILNYYKLCDYRPLFGLIFDDILTSGAVGGCTHWGWGKLSVCPSVRCSTVMPKCGY